MPKTATIKYHIRGSKKQYIMEGVRSKSTKLSTKKMLKKEKPTWIIDDIDFD